MNILQKRYNDVGELQTVSHASGEFVENDDGSIEMVSFDPILQPVVTNYPAFIKASKEIGYKGYINYEYCHVPFREGKVLRIRIY